MYRRWMLALVFLTFAACGQRMRSDVNLGGHYYDSGMTETPEFTEHDKHVLELVLQDLVTNERIADSRQFYGRGVKEMVLKPFGSPMDWPKEFAPEIPGWKVYRSPHDVLGVAALGVDLRYYGTPKSPLPEKADEYLKISVTIYAAIRIGVIGAADISYHYYPKADSVVFRGLSDA